MFWYGTRKKTLDDLKGLMREVKTVRIKSILNAAKPSDFTDSIGTTVFHLAAKFGNIDLIQFLLESGYDIDVRNSHGTTPLLVASLHNNFAIVKFLLDANANIFARNSFNQTPLKSLLEKKYIPGSLTRQLACKLKSTGLKHKDMANVLLDVDKYTIRFALLLKEPEVTREMLKLTPEVAIIPAHCLLLDAMKSHDMENMKVLFHNGHKAAYRRSIFLAEMSKRLGGSPLELESTRPFLQRLAYFNVINESFVQDLENVFATSRKQVLELLLECEVDVVVRNKFKRELLVRLLVNKRDEVMELLHDRVLDPNARDRLCSTALHAVTRHNLPKRIDYLLSRGANPNCRDKFGQTPLFWAWEIETVLPLLRAGARVNVLDVDQKSVFNKTINLTDWIQPLLANLAVLEVQEVSIKRQIAERINSIPEFKEFYDKCKNQITWMKDQVICDDLTLFSVLVKKPEELADRVLDRETVAKILDQARDYKLHEYYVSTIEMNLNWNK